jgi:hypothetical protein
MSFSKLIMCELREDGAADTQHLWVRAEEKPKPEIAGQPNAGTSAQ